MEDKNLDRLVEVTELYLDSDLDSTISNQAIESEDLLTSDSIYQRCELAKNEIDNSILDAAKERIKYVALLPLFRDDFKSLKAFRRPRNTDVASQFCEDFFWDVAERGYNCFVDRPGINSSSALSDDQYAMFVLGDKVSIEWILYMSMPGSNPPKHYWRRNVISHVRQFVGRVSPAYGLLICFVASVTFGLIALAPQIATLNQAITDALEAKPHAATFVHFSHIVVLLNAMQIALAMGSATMFLIDVSRGNQSNSPWLAMTILGIVGTVFLKIGTRLFLGFL